MSKPYLIRRLGWYYPTERFNAFFFGAASCYIVWSYPLAKFLFLLHGLISMTYILFQGQKYWQLKLHRLRGKPFDQTAALAFFRRSQRINLGLIGLMPIVFLVQTFLLHWTIGSTGILLGALAANGFAILEHINYYHRQLSVDNLPDWNYIGRHKRLKVAQLARDLRDGEI
jgi:hypothetical protein